MRCTGDELQIVINGLHWHGGFGDGGEVWGQVLRVIGAAIPASDFAGIVTAILSDVNPEETAAFSWVG